MSTVLKTHVVKIGNSHGIRIPKVWLSQLGLSGDVEMTLQHGRLVVRPAKRARTGWDAQFEAMAKHGDDTLVDEYTPTEWDNSAWAW